MNKVSLLGQMFQTKSKRNCVVKLNDTTNGSAIPKFVSTTSSNILNLNDPFTNYKKSVRIPRIYHASDLPRKIALNMDYLSYNVATGGNSVYGVFGQHGLGKKQTSFGTSSNGIIQYLIDHTIQIASYLPGEKSFSIQMVDINNSNYYDLLTDYHKTLIEDDEPISKLTEVSINSSELANEWIFQGLKYTDGNFLSNNGDCDVSNSIIILFFNIETAEENGDKKVNTFTFVNFPDINSPLFDPNNRIMTSINNIGDEANFEMYKIFHEDAYRGFVFNINDSLGYARQTVKLLHIAGHFGCFHPYDTPMSKATPEFSPEEKRIQLVEIREKLSKAIKNFTGLFKAFDAEMKLMCEYTLGQSTENVIINKVLPLILMKLKRYELLQDELNNSKKICEIEEKQMTIVKAKSDEVENIHEESVQRAQSYNGMQREMVQDRVRTLEAYESIQKAIETLTKYCKSLKIKMPYKNVKHPFASTKTMTRAKEQI